MRRNFKVAIFCLIIAALLIIKYNSVQAKDDLNTITINLNEETKNAPILIHEEWYYSSDSFEVKIFYIFKNLSFVNQENLVFTPQLLNQSIAKDIAIWDYEQYVNGNLTKKEPFVDCEIDDTKKQQICTEPNITFSNNSYTEVQTHYKRSGVLESCGNNFFNLSEYRWYPFDCYQFNRSIGRLPERILFSLKLVLPRTLEPEYSEEAIRGSSLSGVTNYVARVNKTNNEIISVSPIRITVFSPVIGKMFSYFEKDSRVVILPPTPQLASYEPTRQKDNIAPLWLKVSINIVRPERERLLFIGSVIAMLLIVIYNFILKKGAYLDSSGNSLKGIFIVWAFQEGIIELSPTIRPLQITLFDISFLFPLLAILIIVGVKLIKSYVLNKKEMKISKTELGIGFAIVGIATNFALVGLDKLGWIKSYIPYLYLIVFCVLIFIAITIFRHGVEE